MLPIFFSKQSELRKWFIKNHEKEKELWMGFHKVGSGKPSITWPQSVDEALCFGWIDGIRKSLDAESYVIRFTPRKPTSIWSTVNIKKVAELQKYGLMYPAGIEAFSKLNEKRANIYSFEQNVIELDKGLEKIFKKNKKAWAFFEARIPSYKRPAIWWVISARKEATRLRRLDILIQDSEEGRDIKHLRRVKKS